jgi:hypothetical protein
MYVHCAVLTVMHRQISLDHALETKTIDCLTRKKPRSYRMTPETGSGERLTKGQIQGGDPCRLV